MGVCVCGGGGGAGGGGGVAVAPIHIQAIYNQQKHFTLNTWQHTLHKNTQHKNIFCIHMHDYKSHCQSTKPATNEFNLKSI